MDHLVRDQWLMTENIARFERLLKTETDACQRKMLEGLLAMERLKLKNILAPGPDGLTG